MTPKYELFDHTADMGVRAQAPTMAALIPPAAEGFYATIGDLVAGPHERPFVFRAGGGEPEMLLRDFLTELLVLFERNRRRLARYDQVCFDDHGLEVSATAALVDEERSSYHREVKAVTYHELSIRPVPGGFEATFMVDI
jgi:SHS2 domain-containing protein